MNAANFVTCLRIGLIPVFIAVYYSSLEWNNAIACIIFSTACFSDFLDGYLARKYNQTSQFGAFLDPLADKLLVTVAIVLIASTYTTPLFIAPAAFMVAREVLISGLREWMATNNQRDIVAVAYIGKIKTSLQMLGIGFLLATTPDGPRWIVAMGYIQLYAATFFSFWSMMTYLKSAWPVLTSELD
jgi:CDP-diacylglycerol---glycerol-3-phosphate 3-phosphatidyltransferase